MQQSIAMQYQTPMQFLNNSKLSTYLKDRKDLAIKAEERGEATRCMNTTRSYF